MALDIALIIASVSGIIYSTVKKKRVLLITSIIALIIIAAFYAIYSYFYAQNPY